MSGKYETSNVATAFRTVSDIEGFLRGLPGKISLLLYHLFVIYIGRYFSAVENVCLVDSPLLTATAILYFILKKFD